MGYQLNWYWLLKKKKILICTILLDSTYATVSNGTWK